jgi:ATP-binding cassette subfamily B multidrug efflux pump
MNEIQRYSTSAIKIIDLLMEQSRVFSQDQAAGGVLGKTIQGKVEFRDVTLIYGENAKRGRRPALDHVNLIVEPGQTLGIVGLTGAGKTSLVNLIARLYDPTAGAVLIDDIDVRHYNLQELRRNIGMVMQDVFLFSDTVEGNIAYGVPETPVEQIKYSANLSASSEFIENMTDGYDTIVGERGVGLSGGQRQRIALARALALQPRILILDDTTSAVDMETENQIQQAFQREPGTRTVFIIAHRISSVRQAGQILVMDQGQIVERGTHEELLARKGIYYDIFLTQAGLDRLPSCRGSCRENQERGHVDGTQPL